MWIFLHVEPEAVSNPAGWKGGRMANFLTSTVCDKEYTKMSDKGGGQDICRLWRRVGGEPRKMGGGDIFSYRM